MTPETIARYDQRVPRYTSYPTAPHFTPEVTADVYAGWLEALEPATALSLYLHVPFCAELCLYCGCHTSVARSYTPVAAYVECLEREIALVLDRLPARMRVTHLHWGGGTPTMLSPADLSRLMERLRDGFAFEPGGEIAIEIDPRTVTRAHVEALAAAGLNRASLGVQDFDPLVQRTIKRVQSFERTAEVAQWLRAAGVAGINLDLMYGLPHQSAESVVRSVETALALDPDRIALFGYAHVPWMKKHQALLPEEALPNGPERVRQMTAAAEAIRAAGYVAIGLDHFAKPADALARRQSEGGLHRNFQGYTTDGASALIGLGTSAIGALPQGYVQNPPTTLAYRQAVTAGRFATVRGRALSQDDRLRRAVIERLMCDFDADVAGIASDHGVPLEALRDSLDGLAALEREGLVARDRARIVVPEAARPLTRVVCASFDRYLAPGAARHAPAV